jgi:hypothetical protein
VSPRSFGSLSATPSRSMADHDKAYSLFTRCRHNVAYFTAGPLSQPPRRAKEGRAMSVKTLFGKRDLGLILSEDVDKNLLTHTRDE